MRGRALKMRNILKASLLLLLGGCASQGAPQHADSQRTLAEIQTRLAAAYLQEGRYALALDKAQQAVRADAGYAAAYSTLALIRSELGQDALAGEAYAQALSHAPEDPELQNAYGVYLCRQQDYSKADAAFMQAVANPLYATPAMALTNAGVCALQAKRQGEAQRYLQRALQIDPTAVRARQALDSISSEGHAAPAGDAQREVAR